MMLDRALRRYFLDVFWDVEAREEVLATLRPVGYTAFAATIALIALGFAIKKNLLSFAGSLALYTAILVAISYVLSLALRL